MPEMTADERRTFLSTAGRTGVLATVRRDGRPHAAPVWFLLDGEDVVFMTGGDTVKAGNLARDPRATLVVDDASFPFAFAVLEGTCALSDDLDELKRWSTPIAARYVPTDLAEAYGARNAVPGELLVRMTVTKARAVSGVAD
jgi:PPOX class probable F420-dependent enzyme